jgi:hypothetical protein
MQLPLIVYFCTDTRGKKVIWKAHYWDEVSESESKRELGNYIKMDT